MKTNDNTEPNIQKLEARLDDFDPGVRRVALVELCDLAVSGAISLPPPKPIINVHSHTFFSYNCYGYSPSRFAWLARRAGLELAGIVDFDVLDGADEFLAAGRTIGIRTIAGLESRVFVPEFADRVINSPGEPGISYHMGVGFTTAGLEPGAMDFLSGMRKAAGNRNRELVRRVNAYLKPVELDYDRDVVPITPAGNATERHICLAYAQKAAAMFKGDGELAAFWSEKLKEDAAKLDLPAGGKLQNQIRAKTMKQGGPGYGVPDKGSFPELAAMNQFILQSNALPVITWLDGTSAGEQCIDELVAVEMASGAALLNIIPDRNYKPGVKDQKAQNLYDIVKLAADRNLPVICGTEMNSPGQKFVDSFETAELAPLAPVFLRGARIVYAHSVLHAHAGMGYLSRWAAKHFGSNTASKNDFYEEAGKRLRPCLKPLPAAVDNSTAPDQVLKAT